MSVCVRRRARRKITDWIEIASAYFRNHHNLEQPAQIATQLDMSVIRDLRDIMNGEYPALVRMTHWLESMSAEEVLVHTDYRIFRKFLSLHKLNCATSFMNYWGKDEIECQINTLYRLKDPCASNNFKPISKEMTTQFQLSNDAIREGETFQVLMEWKWPKELEIKNNLYLQKSLMKISL